MSLGSIRVVLSEWLGFVRTIRIISQERGRELSAF
jgi:hypothetical protein